MMEPARWPRDHGGSERLLAIDPRSGTFADDRFCDLATRLREGDLLVVNDAATLPASLTGRTPTGDAIEIRLAARENDGSFRAVSFGEGDWRTPTEHRAAAPTVSVGDRLRFDGLDARVESIASVSKRLLRVRFEADASDFWPLLYRAGRPIQYAYVRGALPLYEVQNCYAWRPWAFEMPSAGRPLDWKLLDTLRDRGIHLAALTHAAGISSTGDDTIDALLPLPERYEIPADTVSAIRATRAGGGRVIAVGTSVVRAIEDATERGIAQGQAITDLRLGPDRTARAVDGLLTGMHEPTASHFALLQAFAPAALLDRAYAFAERAGYLCHEFGDSTLILAA